MITPPPQQGPGSVRPLLPFWHISCRGMEHSVTRDNALLERVRKLLAKAEAEGVTSAEAEALTAKAAELIARHGIDRALLAADRPRPTSPPARSWTCRTRGGGSRPTCCAASPPRCDARPYSPAAAGASACTSSTKGLTSSASTCSTPHGWLYRVGMVEQFEAAVVAKLQAAPTPCGRSTLAAVHHTGSMTALAAVPIEARSETGKNRAS